MGAPTDSLKRLMDNARVKLPGALDAAIKMELFPVLKDFFRESNLWTEEFPLNTESGARLYNILPVSGSPTRLIAVLDSSDRPVHASMPATNQVLLTQAPAPGAALRAKLVMTVSDPTTEDYYPEFPEWISDNYFNVILDGVLARMMGQIAKPYTSPQMAAAHLRLFSRGVSRARVDARRRNVYGAQNWAFPRAAV